MNVYDFDGTIYNGDSSVNFLLYALKKKPGTLLYLPKQLWGFVLYALKKIDKTTLKEYYFSFLAAVDAMALAESFWDEQEGRIFDWYLRQRQEDDMVISASPDFLLRPICRRLGISRLIASRVDARSGKFTGANCHDVEKPKRLAAEYGLTKVEAFYSDSLSDLPMAQIAERAYMVKKGKVEDWNI
ncbi:MAG: phosphoserine phosphatase [Ruminococcaceae bacterium]|nr:phosphoserine phosphatase [Oscillospiraceae bacterium]